MSERYVVEMQAQSPTKPWLTCYMQGLSSHRNELATFPDVQSAVNHMMRLANQSTGNRYRVQDTERGETVSMIQMPAKMRLFMWEITED